MIALFYALPLGFILFFSLYTRWQIEDELDGKLEWTKPDEKWHRYGLQMRIMYFLSMVGWCMYPKVDWFHFALLAPIMAVSFDMSINFARKRNLFAVGVDGWDKKIGHWKWVGYVLWIVGTVFLRTYL
jgi:hypothetical protein